LKVLDNKILLRILESLS